MSLERCLAKKILPEPGSASPGITCDSSKHANAQREYILASRHWKLLGKVIKAYFSFYQKIVAFAGSY